jgi:hypothetical protein
VLNDEPHRGVGVLGPRALSDFSSHRPSSRASRFWRTDRVPSSVFILAQRTEFNRMNPDSSGQNRRKQQSGYSSRGRGPVAAYSPALDTWWEQCSPPPARCSASRFEHIELPGAFRSDASPSSRPSITSTQQGDPIAGGCQRVNVASMQHRGHFRKQMLPELMSTGRQ